MKRVLIAAMAMLCIVPAVQAQIDRATLSGTVIRRFPMRFDRVNLRTSLHLGVSTLLFDVYGAPKYSTGLFVGVSPLGLEWKLSRSFLIIINPLSIAVPAPQLNGVPLVYTQYRVGIGVEILKG